MVIIYNCVKYCINARKVPSEFSFPGILFRRLLSQSINSKLLLYGQSSIVHLHSCLRCRYNACVDINSPVVSASSFQWDTFPCIINNFLVRRRAGVCYLDVLGGQTWHAYLLTPISINGVYLLHATWDRM